MIAHRPWTRKEESRLEELRLQGLTRRQIAEQLARSLASIIGKTQELRLPKGGWEMRWLAALDRPHTMRGVAACLGVTYGAVKTAKRRLRRAGFNIPAAQTVTTPRAANGRFLKTEERT